MDDILKLRHMTDVLDKHKEHYEKEISQYRMIILRIGLDHIESFIYQKVSA